MSKRFQDQHKDVYDFIDYFLVKCPRCEKCAKIIITRPEEKNERKIRE